jgi:hypothetical protein
VPAKVDSDENLALFVTVKIDSIGLPRKRKVLFVGLPEGG